ncbi:MULTISPECIES: ATP-binding protein [Williamsia]|uniref:PspC domain-containing protein n=1 Tax=Williamsia marianensis TaxID=85044 RepID=A0ABU4EU02_WILMA|nr:MULTISPECIES: ATP-binding protein [Williamsia]MCK0518124.1 PspC domain-containing protein [Williamsia sp. DF01-3]MDV7134127.1 PspC domain-containing protein [Williamsia muralis]
MPTVERVHRRDGGRVIGGVAGGVADHLGVDAFRVRVVFVVLSALAGAGVCAYGLLWFMCPPGTDTEPPTSSERRQGIGLAIVGVVAVVSVGFVASGTPAQFLIPLVVVAVGASLVWRELDSTWRPRSASARAITWTRIAGGATLVVIGLVVVVLAGNNRIGGLSTTLLAVAATVLGVLLLTIPLWLRMARMLGAERAARIRNAEREEIAAHLHDSVLQTLALIQKRSGHAEEVQRLARSQERELRRYLFEGEGQQSDSLTTALKAVAAEVEDHYGVEVEVVTVGDVTADDPSWSGDHRRWAALIAATREALVNAAKHSGERSVDVYAEVESSQVEVFVRDRGVGFDPDQVPEDRRGVSGSIKARVQRHGGSVEIKSTAGRGVDVRMSMPRGGETPLVTDLGEDAGSESDAVN